MARNNYLDTLKQKRQINRFLQQLYGKESDGKIALLVFALILLGSILVSFLGPT